MRTAAFATSCPVDELPADVTDLMPHAMVEVAANPKSVPWVEGCPNCAGLAGDPEPGTSSWCLAAYSHFEHVHKIALVGA